MEHTDRKQWKEEDPLQMPSNSSFSKQQGWNLRDYCSKLLHISQMDIEYNFAQLFYSLFAPSKLYMLTKWRKRNVC